jgi:hypothetical protein
MYIQFAQRNGSSYSSTLLYSDIVCVPHSKSGVVPCRRCQALGSWGSGKLEKKGWDNWVKGGANRVSLQAT